jgi:hypothetical protein
VTVILFKMLFESLLVPHVRSGSLWLLNISKYILFPFLCLNGLDLLFNLFPLLLDALLSRIVIQSGDSTQVYDR